MKKIVGYPKNWGIFVTFFLALLSSLAVFGQTSQGTGNWSSTSSWVSGVVPTATSGSCTSGSAASSTCNAPVSIGTNLVIDQAISISSGVFYVTGSPTDATGGTAYTLTMSTSGSYTTTQNILDIKSGTTTFEGAASLKNANLYVRNGATLILGGLSLSSSGKCNVVIETGGTLIINGDVTDNDNGGTFTIDGYVQINGNFTNTTGNVTVNASSGVFQTTGTMTTSGGSSTINGSNNDCATGPCSAGSITCGSGGSSYTSSVSPTSQVLCSGQTISPISFVTNATGTLAYQWQISTTGGGSGFTNISGATSASYTPSQPSVTTWYRMSYTTSSCTGTTLISPSSEISLNNNTAPVAGSISGGGVTYCSGTNSTALTLSGYTATGFQWQSSSDNVTFSNISGASSSTYTPTNVSSTTYYRVVVSNGSCNTVSSSSVSITIASASTAAVLSGTASICTGSSTNLVVTITGGTSPFQVKYSDGTATTTVSSYTSGSNISISPTSNTTYSLVSVVSSNGSGCTGSGLSGTPVVTVNQLPNDVSNGFTGNQVCLGGTGTLTFDADNTYFTSGSINYSDGTTTWNQTISSNASTTFNLAVNPTVSTSYSLVSITNEKGCVRSSGFANSTASVTIYQSPNDVTSTGFTGSTICSGNTGTLTFDALNSSFTSGSIQYSDGTTTWSQTILSSAATTFNVAVNPTSTTVYTLESITNEHGCVATSGFAVSSATITVNSTPTVNSVSNQSVCAGGSTSLVSLSGSVSGTTYNWVNDSPGIGLAASGTGNISSFTAVNSGTSDVVATITVTPSTGSCTGSSTSFTITAHPASTVNSVSSQSVCAGGSTSLVSFSGSVSGTTYSWVNDTPGIGLAASGTGNISSFTAVNSGTSDVLATITVTPSANSCTGSSTSFTITVHPTPTVNSISNQTLCAGSTTSSVTFSGSVGGTTYSWVNDTPGIGLAASGTGNISSFTAVNSGTSDVVATITVTPSASSCAGSSTSFTITAHPASTVNSVSSQSLCAGGSTSLVSFSGPVSGTTYSWVNNTPGIGLAASGTGNISSFTAVNSGTSDVVATITVTPSANSCAGSSTSFTIKVHPTPTLNSVSNQTLCAGSTTSSVTFSGSVGGTTYSWVNDTPGIGLAASGTGNISSFTAVNSGTSDVMATVAVTPSANSCNGSSISFTITVSPSIAIGSQSTAGQVQCSIGGLFSTPISVNAIGDNLTYQWYSNSISSNSGGTAVTTGTGGTTSSYTPSAVSSGVTYYYCIVSGSCGSATSAVSGAFVAGNVWNGSDNNWFNSSNWGGCTISSSSDLVIPGGLSNYPVASGAISANSITINSGASLSMGSFPLTIASKLQNDGTFNAGTSTVTFAPAAGATANISGSVMVTFYNLTVTNNTGTTDLKLQNTAGAALTNVLNVGTATLDVNGKPFTLISTETCGATTSVPTTSDASIAAIGTGGAILGNVTVQRFMCRASTSALYYHTWRDISPPVSGATVHDLQQSIPVSWANPTFSSVIDTTKSHDTSPVNYNVSSIQVYNESTSAWNNFLTASSTDTVTFKKGTGYSTFIFGKSSENANGNDLWSLTGKVNKGPVSIPVTFTSSTKGWNLVGNPFASTIDWALIRGNSSPAAGVLTTTTGGSFKNIMPTIYVENYSQGTLTYSTYNSVSNVGTYPDSHYIATGQAFFIRTSASSPSLTFSEGAKAAGTQTKFYRESAPANLVRITLTSSDNLHDDALIYFSEKATDEFDDYDALKLFNKDGFMNLSSLSPAQENYAINAMPLPDHQKRIPLDIRDVLEGTYSLTFTEFSSLPSSLRIQLEDKFENTITDIRENAIYGFKVDSNNKATFGSERFSIILGGEEIQPIRRVKVYPIPVTGVLTIEAEGEEAASGEILNMVGLSIGTISFTDDGNSQIGKYDFQKENTGIYFVRVKQGDRVSMVRIVKD